MMNPSIRALVVPITTTAWSAGPPASAVLASMIVGLPAISRSDRNVSVPSKPPQTATPLASVTDSGYVPSATQTSPVSADAAATPAWIVVKASAHDVPSPAPVAAASTYQSGKLSGSAGSVPTATSRSSL